MTDSQKINEHIYNNTLFGNNCRFSSFIALDEFFETVPKNVQKMWPYNIEENGYKSNYEVAEIVSEQLGFDSSLEIIVNVANDSEGFIINDNLKFEDDKLIVNLKSMYRHKGDRGQNFSSLVLGKHQEFISAYDQNRKNLKPSERSEIIIYADSDRSNKDIKTVGGYVWANRGFDFQDKREQAFTRNSFQAFAKTHGVEIEKNDLKLFTKPCHFAAFGCGVGVKAENGQMLHLGKAFMLQHSWRGKWRTDKPQAEEKRYAQAYACCLEPQKRRRQAVAQLSPRYQNLLKKYYRKYQGQHKSHSFSAYTRLASIKLSKLLHALHR